MSLFHTPSALMSANAPRLVLLSLTAPSLLLALSPPPPSLSLSLSLSVSPFRPLLSPIAYIFLPLPTPSASILLPPFPPCPCLSSSLPLSFSPCVAVWFAHGTACTSPQRAETRKPVSAKRANFRPRIDFLLGFWWRSREHPTIDEPNGGPRF